MFKGFDIFGIPLEFATEDSRVKRWPHYIWQLSQSLHIEIQACSCVSIYNIYRCVFEGFLSFQTASYFCLGKSTVEQDNYLRAFVDFLVSNSQLSSSKISLLWQGLKRVPENTFPFPLVAPACSVMSFSGFQAERDEFIKKREKMKAELARIQFLSMFDDLPPDDVSMPSA